MLLDSVGAPVISITPVSSLAAESDPHSWALMALDAAPYAVLIIDSGDRILFANACSERTFGLSRSELLGTLFEALLAADCRSSWLEDLSDFFAGRQARESPERCDKVCLGKGGQRFPLELSLGRFGIAASPMAIVIIRDLTEQRHAEERLAAVAVEAEETRDRLETLLEFAPAFIIAMNREGNIEFINRTLPQYTKKDTIGSSFRLYFAADRHLFMETMFRTVYEKGSTEVFELSTPGPDGVPVWFESHIGPMRIGGQIVGTVLVSQDVTERKRAQVELLAGRHMALLGTLAAGVAHEINTPVQFVGDSIHFLRDAAKDLLDLLGKLQDLRQAALEGRPLDEMVRAAAKAEEAADLPYIRQNMPQAFENCISGLNQVATIVRSLKDFSHPSEKEMVPTDLNRTVQNSLTIATSEYKFVATLEMELGDLPPVTCHANEIGQAVLNITVNAAHAIADAVGGSDRKGVITVRTWRDGDFAVISIHDTGDGIPENVRSRIFDPFFTTKEVGRGTGQGLAIAWSAVKERHKGQLTFETKKGEGTTFFMRLPIAGTATPA
jgi:PAS domain S-box-containing protein